jgi:hypothetical protein
MATKDKTDVVPTEDVRLPPAFVDQADYGTGFEGSDKDSFAIPFLQILQKMSPLVDEDSPKRIEGAKPGMLYNTVTRQMYDGKQGIIIIPCAFKRSYIHWGSRDGDGGFKGEYTPEQIDAIKDDKTKVVPIDGKLLIPDKNGDVNEKKSDYYADTRSHYILYIDPLTKDIHKACLSLSSTQIKPSKMMLTALQQLRVPTPQGKRTPPTFANMVRLVTTPQSNAKGSWSLAQFTVEGYVTDPEIYQMAKDFHKAIVAGDIAADYSKAVDSGDAGGPAEDEKF